MVKISKSKYKNDLRRAGKTSSGVSSLLSTKSMFFFIVGFVGYRMLWSNEGQITSIGNLPSPPAAGNVERALDKFIQNGGSVRGGKEATRDTEAPDEAIESQNGAHHEQKETNDDDGETDAPKEIGDKEVKPKQATTAPQTGQKPVKTGAGNSDTNGAGLNLIVIDKKGTGPTNVGYVKDFVEERKNPKYREVGSPIIDHAPAVAKFTNEKSVTACHNESTGTILAKCMDSDTPLIAFNSESFVRTWCGSEIPAKSAIVMSEHCMDPVSHLFPEQVPPNTGEHMPPIIVKTTANGTPEAGKLEQVDCDIPCQFEQGLTLSDGSESFIDGEPWKVTTRKNDHQNVKLLRSDFMNNQYYSTQSLFSSIPLTSFDPEIHSLLDTSAVDFDETEPKAIYIAEKMCNAQETKRNRWFEAVQEKMTVDAFGKCGNNAEVPSGMSKETPKGRIELMKKYRVVLALETSKSKDAISEVVWEALASGALPVIVGADNLSERLPPRSFINVSNFNKYGELGDYVKKVTTDKKLWESYQEWRKDESLIAALEERYQFGRTNVRCRMCRWAYAKKYGLGWDHMKQEVRPIPKVPKEQFCTTADHGLVSKPFSEHWVTKHIQEGSVSSVLKEDADGASCSSLETEGDVVVDAFKGHRKIYQHDGVTDFTITEWVTENTDTEAILRLNFPGVRNPEGACFSNTHTTISNAKGTNISSASIADDIVKVTVLASWDTKITSTAEGIMEVVVNNGTPSSKNGDSIPRRIRVIIEEINYAYDKMTEFMPSTYFELMTKDFINPLGVFIADE